jgi:hypothetical protein
MTVFLQKRDKNGSAQFSFQRFTAAVATCALFATDAHQSITGHSPCRFRIGHLNKFCFDFQESAIFR